MWNRSTGKCAIAASTPPGIILGVGLGFKPGAASRAGRWLAFALVACLAQGTLAAESKKVSLLVGHISLRGSSGELNERDFYETFLCDRITKATRSYSVLSVGDVSSQIEYQHLKEQFGCDSETCLAEIAGSINSDFVVFPKLIQRSDKHYFQLTLINQVKAQVVKRSDMIEFEWEKQKFEDVLTQAIDMVFAGGGEQSEPASYSNIELQIYRCLAGEEYVCWQVRNILDRRTVISDALSDVIKAATSKCEAGNAWACYFAGLAMEQGYTGPRSTKPAKYYYKSACLSNVGPACEGFVSLLERQRQEKGQYEFWKDYFEELLGRCKDDAENACAVVAWFWLHGRGIPKAPPSARKFAKRSCDAGSALGCLLTNTLLRRGIGGPEDRETARDVLRGVCGKGHPGACYRLASMEYDGEGGARNHTRARETFEAGCNLGSLDSCFKLANMMVVGDGGDQDYKGARAIYKDGCSIGHMQSCGLLGMMWFDGKGGPEDKKNARRYLKTACDGGLYSSCLKYGKMLKAGIGGPVDVEKGKEYVKKAFEKKN